MCRHGTFAVLLALACLAAPATSGAGPFDPIRVGSDHSRRAAILQALDQPTDLDFARTPLHEVLDAISVKHEIDMQVDRRSLEEAGISINEAITSNWVGTVTAREALELIFKPLELTWMIHRDVLLITTQANEETIAHLVIYPVEDLLVGPSDLQLPGRRYPPDYDSLIELLTSMLPPTAWGEIGGAAPIYRCHGALVVRQTQQVHEEIGDLLTQVRLARWSQFPQSGKHPPAPARSTNRQRAKTVYAALAEPLDLDLAEVDLREFSKRISKQCEIAVAIDERALQESGIDADKVQFSKRLKQLSLQDALALLLPEHELGWTVHGGVLLITSRSETEMAMEVRVYPIRGLGSRPEASPRLQYTEAYETLPELITSVIALTTWADVGAAGAAKVVPSAAALVVSQTAEVHEEIAAYLAGLRKFRADHPLEPAGESEASPGEDELVLFKYNIPSDLGWDTEAAPPAKAGDKTASGAAAQPSTAETQTQTRKVPASLATRERIANQFAAALPRLVEPESWQAGGGEGTIEVVSDLLYIRQRMAIHGRIATFLQPAVSWPAPVAPRIAPMGAGGGQF